MTPHRTAFDNATYIRLQSDNIKKRIGSFGGKLYLEFGGKLFDDYHASRVLPGFLPDTKVNMLCSMKEQAEIIIAISASSIEKSKKRGDLGITYENEVFRLIDAFRSKGLFVGSVVITRYAPTQATLSFEGRLTSLGIPVYRHYTIPDYPSNVPLIVSEDGYGKNDYIKTTRPLVVVTAPGPGSGKMATCLSQLYHENLRGVKAGYAKFETFPIWNLPLGHAVNRAYEAATADLDDVNMIDPYHLEAYGEKTVNYNRDIEIFPVLDAIFKKIYGTSPYKSPTDMGVNMAGFAIVDDEAATAASRREILRRYYAALEDRLAAGGEADDAKDAVVRKLELLKNTMEITDDERPVIAAAEAKAKATGAPAFAIELPDGEVVTGKTSSLLGASSAALLNALKRLAGVPDEVDLISPDVIEPIQHLKVQHMGNKNPRLHIDELLITLAICAVTDKNAASTIECIDKLHGLEAHSTVVLSRVDEQQFRRLGVNLTCSPVYETKKIYRK